MEISSGSIEDTFKRMYRAVVAFFPKTLGPMFTLSSRTYDALGGKRCLGNRSESERGAQSKNTSKMPTRNFVPQKKETFVTRHRGTLKTLLCRVAIQL